MKRMITITLAIMMCFALVSPAFAEAGFVPSISYKPGAGVVQTESGFAGVIKDADGNVVAKLDHACLLITTIAEVLEGKKEIPQEIVDLLTFLYEALGKDMELPYEKHEAGLNAEEMVVRDLYDIRWTCEEHAEMLKKDGYTLELTFDMKMEKDVEIYAMTYDEETEEWTPIVEARNNGDGTITCVFDTLGAVEFSIVQK